MSNVLPKAEWKPDDECLTCEGCDAAFGFFRRRHHCRRCGGVFCDSCCAERIKGLPGYEHQHSQRICSSCKQAMTAIREVGRMRPRERRICVLGSVGTGELSLLHYLCVDASQQDQKPMTFARTCQMSCRGSEYVFSVLDAGQAGCDMFQPQYTIGTHAYVLVFNVMDRNSFLLLPTIRGKILECGVVESAMVIVGSKSEHTASSRNHSSPPSDRQVTFDEAEALAKRWGIPYKELSTRRQRLVDELRGLLLKMIVDHERDEQS